MANSPAQIDSDYRGEWLIKMQAIPISFTPARNNGVMGPGYIGSASKTHYPMVPYLVGDRIGQIWLEKVIDFQFEEAEELSDTDRGSGGFGSTGK
jgi:dUTP pyrophosphatase